MKTAIVSGAAGFVGYHLVKKLQEEDFFVVALCHNGSRHNERLKKFEKVKIIECDISQLLSLSEDLKKYNPLIFYHLAWNGTTGEERGNYALQLENVRYTCDAYICACLAGCSKFVSTGTVYEQLTQQIMSLKEFSNLTYYVFAKKYAYETLVQLQKKMNIDFVWCTFCQPIGRFIKTNQLMAYIVLELKNGRMPLLGEGKNPFDMIPVEDLARALFMAGTIRLSKQRYYIGSGRPRYLREYLCEASEIVSPNVQLIFGKRPDDGLKFSFEWLNDNEFSQETGFESKVSFEKGVKNVISWIEELESMKK